MAFPEQAVLVDDFNRADGTLGLSWGGPTYPTGNPLPIIASNEATWGVGSGSNTYWTTLPSSADVEAYATKSSPQPITLLFRVIQPETLTAAGYAVASYSSTVYLLDYNGGSINLGSPIASWPVTLSVGDKLGVKAVGASISVYYYNGIWNLIDTVVDSTYTSLGYFGFILGFSTPPDTYGTLDDFYAGPFPVTPPQDLADLRRFIMVQFVKNSQNTVYARRSFGVDAFEWGGQCSSIDRIVEEKGAMNPTLCQGVDGGVVVTGHVDGTPGLVTTTVMLKEQTVKNLGTRLESCLWDVDRRNHCDSLSMWDSWQTILRLAAGRATSIDKGGSTMSEDSEELVTSLPWSSVSQCMIYRTALSVQSFGGGGE